MTRVDVVVLAMLRLGGDSKGLDMEDIAVECHKESPKTFSWRKYPEQINMLLVANAIQDAKRVRNGALVSGGQHQGWRLTVAGQEYAQKMVVVNAKPTDPISVPGFRGAEGKRIKQEYSRTLQSDAFSEWSSGDEISESAMNSLLKINAYTSDELLEIKKTRLARCRGITEEMDSFLDKVLR
jgi:hypothetical protein